METPQFFIHSGDLGDLIYALPTIREMGGGTVVLAPHKGPDVGPRGGFTKGDTDQVAQLLTTGTDYVTSVIWLEGDNELPGKVFDLRSWRGPKYGRGGGFLLTTGQSEKAGQRPDFSQPWMQLDPEPAAKGKIVISRSPRYQSSDSLYHQALELFGDRAVFIGLKPEYEAFIRKFGRALPHRPTDLLGAARWIAGADHFVGNQSAPFALAEALKRPATLEAHPHIPDVHFVRPGLEVVPGPFFAFESFRGPVPEREGKLLIAMQYWERDRESAAETLRYMASLEPTFQKGAEILLAARFDSSIDSQLVTELSAKFKVHTFKSPRRGVGHPFGCNELWHATIWEVYRRCRDGQMPGIKAILTTEPDGLPVSRDWIQKLSGEYDRGASIGKFVLGVWDPWPGPVGHINGNMIVAWDVVKRVPGLEGCPPNAAWDGYHAPKFRPVWMTTELIRNHYRHHGNPVPVELLDRKFRGRTPVFIHGIQGTETRAYLKEKLAV